MEQLQKMAIIKACELSESDIEAINSFAITPIDKEKIYTFKIVLCDNEVDRDFEAFTTQALYDLADMFIGKTGIKDHSMRSNDQIARIYKAEVVVSEDKKTSYGEPYAQLVACAYTLKSSSTEDFIAEIDAGIKKEVSVSCALNRATCSICGKERRAERCNHISGSSYEGKLCFTFLSNPVDAYEFSFVAVPAQRNAGVSKNAQGFFEREPYPVKEQEKEKEAPTLMEFLEKAFLN